MVITVVICHPLASSAAPNVFRSWFTPTVVPTNFAGPVRFEAQITENPASVVFTYNGVNRQMYDDGSNGDLVAGDTLWTCLFTTSEIFARNFANRVFRPFIGTCTPAGSAAFNTVAEVWTPEIGLVPITTNMASSSQETDYVVNYVATRAQLTNFNAAFWASRFYTTHGDKFDFLNFVHIAGVRGNRYHAGVKNTVLGISTSTYSNNASFGSAGRLQGYTVFPISSFYDGASPTFSHETGHQWINFLSGTAYAGGIPHWPKGNIAINVMGFSIAGGNVGGTFPYTFNPDGGGNYVVGPDIATNHSTFNLMELYLAGLAAPSEVPTYFVLNNQNQTLMSGQVLTPAEFTLVNLSDVVAARGPRVPNSANSQMTFRCATIILSEQLLDPYAMSFYDFFTRRIEARTPQAYADGLATGTSNPWLLATSRRSVMFAKIADERPVLEIIPTNNNVRINFTGKPGIRYQPQLSADLAAWTNDGTDMLIPIDSPGMDVATNFVRAVPPGPSQSYYRLKLIY